MWYRAGNLLVGRSPGEYQPPRRVYLDEFAGRRDVVHAFPAACKAITHRFPLERWAEAVLTLKDSHRTGRSEGPARTWPLAAEQCRCAASLLCG